MDLFKNTPSLFYQTSKFFSLLQNQVLSGFFFGHKIVKICKHIYFLIKEIVGSLIIIFNCVFSFATFGNADLEGKNFVNHRFRQLHTELCTYKEVETWSY